MDDVVIIIGEDTREVSGGDMTSIGVLLQKHVIPLIEDRTKIDLNVDIVSDMGLMSRRNCQHEFVLEKNHVTCSVCKKVFQIVFKKKGKTLTKV